MGFGWQEIDKTLDLGYIRVAGLHRECKPAVLFEPPNFRPRTMTHTFVHHKPNDKNIYTTNKYVHLYVHVYTYLRTQIILHKINIRTVCM